MTEVPFSQARSRLTDIVNEVAYGAKRVILTRKGKRLAAIISLEDLKALEEIARGAQEHVTKEINQDVVRRPSPTQSDF